MAEENRGTVSLPSREGDEFSRPVHWDTFMLLYRLVFGFEDLPSERPPRRAIRVPNFFAVLRSMVGRIKARFLKSPARGDVGTPPRLPDMSAMVAIRRALDERGGLGGLALSGGGIRSATLSLGVLQAVAMQQKRDLPTPRPPGAGQAVRASRATTPPPGCFRDSLLAEFGYLSTVSGGGYIGSFLSSLFIPNRLDPSHGNVMQLAATAASDDALKVLQNEPPGRVRAVSDLTVSRQNPSPIPLVPAVPQQGQDRLIQGPLAWLRDNGRYLTPTGAGDAFYAGSLAVRNLVSVHYVIGSAVLGACALLAVIEALAHGLLPEFQGKGLISASVLMGWWISPAFAVAGFTWLAWSVPAGASFWMPYPIDNRDRSNYWNGACTAFVGAGAFFAALARYSTHANSESLPWMEFVWGYAAGAAFVAVAMYLGARLFNAHVSSLRTSLTRSLTLSLQFVSVMLVLGVVDSLAHTSYTWLMHDSVSVANKATSLATPTGAAGALIWLVRKFALSTAGKDSPSLLKKVPLQWLAGVAGLAVLGLMAVFWGLVAVALIWQGEPLTTPDTTGARVETATTIGKTSVQPITDTTVVATLSVASRPAPPKTHDLLPAHIPATAAAIIATVSLLVSIVIGRFPSFINLSSLQSFYSARLTRAYLGASNGKRFDAGDPADPATRRRASAAEPMPSDQVWFDEYTLQDRLSTYAPLHLINTTMNNTDAPGEQLVQRDRKGQPVVVTPFGFSIDGDGPYQFPQGNDQHELDRTLNVGQWTGISGAAVSTGLGRDNSLGLSLLLGAANIRLGSWWNSNKGSAAPDRASRTVNRIFPTQSYLFNEFASKFHGLARPYQYLTDGGHFENTGAYELLRPERCVKFILACDHGADRGYEFGDLANLVRLVRIDLQIELLVEDGVARDPVLRQWFGVPKDFQKTESSCCGGAPRCCCTTASDTHTRREPIAILLRAMRGPSLTPQAWVVLLKPRVCSDSAADVIQYGLTHPAFPQETTGDQFFDEAQWESYRKLAFDNASIILGERVWTALQAYIESNGPANGP